MNTRNVATILAAGILILLVMGVASIIAFTGWVGTQKYAVAAIWEQPFESVQSMKIVDLSGDGQNDLFLQNLSSVAIWDAQGKEIFVDAPGENLVSTMGDVDGDGIEDILAVYQASGSNELVFVKQAQVAWRSTIQSMGIPARIASMRFSSGPQIILGDINGNIISLDVNGKYLWEEGDLFQGETRGLDDALVNGEAMLAVIDREGTVALFNDAGASIWEYRASGGLRRMRAYDLDGDRNGEILIGGENNALVALNASDGQVLFERPIGQTITEIRSVELDGEPASLEILVGGKSGGLWAFTATGEKLWSASVSDKVTEIIGVDLDEDGREEVVIGDDSGAVNLFNSDGDRFKLFDFNSGVARLDIEKLGDSKKLASASQNQVKILELEADALPALRFTPLLVGLAASAVILLLAWFIITNPPKPALQVAFEDQSPDSLQAQRRMLKESIADVERLRSSGEVTSDAYLKRLKELRRQLADNEAAMKKAGLQYVPETITCPSCGGSLPLGVDRCEYCGQTVIH
jgi:outer membrane protein assembly factor BamB